MSEDKEGSGERSLPSPSSSLVEYLQHLQSCIQPLTRTAAQLPGPSDLSFHKSLDRRLANDLGDSREAVVSVINDLILRLPGSSSKGKGRDNARGSDSTIKAAQLIDEDGFATHLGDVIDTLLENTDTCLDEYQGRVAPRSTQRSRELPSRGANGLLPAVGPLPAHILNAPIRPMPQEKFRRKANNTRETRWQHTLTTKPNAKVPLTWRPPAEPGQPPRQGGIRQGMYCAEGDPMDNPYYFEISNFAPPAYTLDIPSIDQLQPPPPLVAEDPTGGPIPFLWVDDETTFQALYDHLNENRVKEIAIDVEHHNFHSYQGLVCLVQISTRWNDYIIDGLNPFIRDVSHKLNDIMTKPDKVKILHGAEHDILWLQRDLNVYIVGLFDTYHATNVLNFSQHSLAYLLQKYINFIADKRYQLADWRIRPLPPAMMYYARSDTHSLIHVYDCMRFELAKAVGTDAITEVFELSKRTAAKTYAKEEWDIAGETREGWRTLWKKLANEEAFGVDARWEKGGVDGLTCTERIFRALHDWRDRVARMEDESARFVLSSAHMLNLASRAPTTAEAVTPCIGQAFKRRSNELAQLISSEKEAFAANQERSAAIQREVLRQQQQDGVSSDELGQVVGRSDLSSPRLWPESQRNKTEEQHRNSSNLATLLFPGVQQETRPVEKQLLSAPKVSKQSLFAPRDRSAQAQARLQAIRKDLKSALRGLMQAARSKVQGAAPIEAQHPDAGPEPLHDPQHPLTSAADASQGESTGAVSNAEEKVSSRTATAEVQEDDVVQNVRKKKRNRRDRQVSVGNDASIEHAGTPVNDANDSMQQPDGAKPGKKRRWTKEEKEARKAQRLGDDDETKREGSSADITPFDFSTAVSVLDQKPDANVQSHGTGMSSKKGNDSRKERMDKQKQEKEEGKAKSDRNPPSRGRYSNVPVGRDRREQAGGKSMTFSS